MTIKELLIMIESLREKYTVRHCEINEEGIKIEESCSIDDLDISFLGLQTINRRE